ncbi:MAG: MMPL family transporter [Dehalococcoidia bacterium]
MVQALFAGCATLIARRYVWLLAISGVVTIALGFGITRLEFKTSQDTLISPNTQIYKDNLEYQRLFGGEPMLVLFQANDIRDLFSAHNMEEMAALDRELGATGKYHAIISPLLVASYFRDSIPTAASLVGGVIERVREQAAAEARAEAAAAGATPAEQEAAAAAAADAASDPINERNAIDGGRLAEAGELSLDNPKFVDFVLFDEHGDVRPELKGVLMNKKTALMVVRLNGNLSLDDQSAAAQDVVDIVHSRNFENVTVTPSGPAVLLSEINETMRGSVLVMGALAVGVMTIVLAVMFRARWRLLSLGAVLMSTVWAFGLIGYLGIPLTMVTISALPVLIGLGVDFAIQVHSRYEEEIERSGNAHAALSETLTHLGPPLTIAVIAASSGFMVLQISAVPMVQDFGSMLSVGSVLILIASIVFMGSVLYCRDRGVTERFASGKSRLPIERVVRTVASPADARVLPGILIGLLLIGAGFWVDHRVTVQTDPERWVPQDSPILQDLFTIRDAAGSSAELNLLVDADDVTSDEMLAWMAGFQQRAIDNHPHDIVTSGSIASALNSVVRATPVQSDANAVLPTMPESLKGSFVSEDRKHANIIFAIGDVSLKERERLTDQIAADLDAPAGVRVRPAGLAVIGIETVNALSANRSLMVYLALAVKFAWFLIVYRSLARTLLVLFPVVIAVSAASTFIYLFNIEINPLTALSGPLVIAISVEFSVLLMGRYLEERGRGRTPREAIDDTNQRIGRAIMASGLTMVGGFGVLAFSGFPLLESFGIVTAMDVGIALLTTLLLLPSLLVWADQQIHVISLQEQPALAD